MDINKMTKDELELMSNKDITYYILEGSKKTINTGDLYKKIIKLLELPESIFDAKIGDYYTSLTTDKDFVLLDDGNWDLRDRQPVSAILTEDDDVYEEDDLEDIEEAEEDMEEILSEEDDDDAELDLDDIDDDEEDDLDEDLTIIDEEELED